MGAVCHYPALFLLIGVLRSLVPVESAFVPESMCSPEFVRGACNCTLTKQDNPTMFIDFSQLATKPLVTNDAVNVWRYYFSFCRTLSLPNYPRCHQISSVCQIYGDVGYDVGRPENTRFEWQIRPGSRDGEFTPSLVTDNGLNERTIAYLMCEPKTDTVEITADPWFANVDFDGYRLTLLNMRSRQFCKFYKYHPSSRNDRSNASGNNGHKVVLDVVSASLGLLFYYNYAVLLW